MKYLRLALFASFAALGLARAQDEERRAPPTEIPDFSNLEEYVYEPKSVLAWGFRRLSGAKASFSGTGRISGIEDAKDATTPNIGRAYHDGIVNVDSRTAPRLDAGGNPAIDPESGATISDPIAPDGKTNSWSYTNQNQLTPEGYLAFHTYTADIIDTTVREQKGESTSGMELTMTRDMGNLFGSKVTWKITGGMALNDISIENVSGVRANINALTDYYSLFGATPPDAPYSAPSSTQTSALDANGNPLLNETGGGATTVVDTTILIGSRPAGRETVVTTNDTSVINRWKLKGAFFTFRVGPTVYFPITNRLRASLSVGAALAYAGTNYTVTELLTPDFGSPIEETDKSAMYKLLPGYYADATLQYDLTDRAGFYAGAVYQSTGSYDQNVTGTGTNYSTKVDLSSQNGLRAGMTVRF